MKSAVLFIVFNRPETTRRVFESIRSARPPRLYVAADGPRSGREGETDRCAEVRRIATAVDWPCEVKTLFRDTNLGCKIGVSSGIDWFFSHEVEGIVLEDDVLPYPEFFPYCEALLERYRDDTSIAMISGCSFIGQPDGTDASYIFSRYLHVWGWAGWRRAWAHYDVTMSGWPSSDASARLADVLGGRSDAIVYWSAIFDAMQRGEIDTWDYQFVYSSWMQDMTAIMPAGMLVENLGFGADATHTGGDVPAAVRNARPANLHFPLRHPDRGSTGRIDAMIERVAFGLTLERRLKQLVRRMPVVGDAVARYRSRRSA